MTIKTNSVITKSFLTGLTGSYLFGWKVGAIAAAANVGLAACTGYANQTSWIKPQHPPQQIWQQLKGRVKQTGKYQVIVVVTLLLLGPMYGQNLTTYVRLTSRRDFATRAMNMGRACVIAPIVKEIFFRGFVQEGIEAIQHKCGDSTTDSAKEWRIGLQGLVFGMAHYFLFHHVSNGLWLGYFKEEHGIHTAIALHMAMSTLTSLRLFIVGK